MKSRFARRVKLKCRNCGSRPAGMVLAVADCNWRQSILAKEFLKLA